MNKYLIEHAKFKKPILIGFNQFGIICFYDGADLDEPQSKWFTANLPLRETDLQWYGKKHQYLRIKPVAMDTSFEAAYEAYNLKIGKKEKARKLWDDLPEVERQLFFRMIGDYKAYLTKTGYGQAYFEVFLRNHYWKNDYKSKLL